MDLDRVRAEALKAGLVEVYYNPESRVVSFAAPDGQAFVQRINVYYTTGTIGTCLDHPRQGKTQLFRRNVDLALLAQLFRDPRTHTGAGYHRRNAWNLDGGSADHRGVDDRCESVPKRADVDPLDEEAELRAQAARLQKDLADVNACLAACVKRREAEERRQAKLIEQAAEMQLALRRFVRGTKSDFWLSDADSVSEMFRDDVTCVATNGTATIMLYEDGGWAFTGGLTKYLYNKLNGRQKSLPSPDYVALGSMDRYYIQFADGKSEWCGCDELTKTLNESSRCVKTVAFGEAWDSFFVVFDDGCWACRAVPDGLSKKLKARDKKADLKCVSLGGDGAWYLEAMNGKSWWGGVRGRTIPHIGRTNVQDRRTFLDFGSYDGHHTQYFARYEPLL